ncbi:hypothetical protein BJ165DRAFT_329195 [Panaeolus papilionaceus]|nr:hypothetical protein BJ165DRAFT_329195 [Panaeolus papilionaceus]
MSTNIQEYNTIQVNGPISIVPITPEHMKGEIVWLYILMGPTGSGKSSFIESLAPDQHLDISKDSLESVTQEVNCYQVVNLGLQAMYYSDRLFVLMDTPGFLDPRLSEGWIMRMVTESLNAIHQFSSYTTVYIFYFQPITDIRIGGSKRDAVKILRKYIDQYNAEDISVITTMWNQLSTPKQLEDASCRFDTLKEEIYAGSGSLGITVKKFDTSQASALSLLDRSSYGWQEYPNNANKVMDPHYQSHLCNNLLGRITTVLQQLQFLAEDKQSATRSGSEDHCLLEVVLREEKMALSLLQSFLDDLSNLDNIGPSGIVALQCLLDTLYEQDPGTCSSPWVPLQVPGLDRLGITSAPIPSTPHGQPPSPDASCFAPIAAAIKRRFNRAWK